MAHSVNRRSFIAGSSGITLSSFAGCLGDEPEDTGNGDTEDVAGEENDDHEVVGSDGLIYAFGSDRISILDPATGEIIDELTEEISDITWRDPQITHNSRYIFTVAQRPSQVHVIDTGTRRWKEAIDVGPGVNHIYHPFDDEIWVHADEEGAFYIIDVDNLNVTEIVNASLEEEGHGKLLFHEDMGKTGYATNVSDPGLSVIDMDGYERTEFIEFGDAGGTHYKAYGPRNGLAYVEYFRGTVVVDTDTNEIVDELDSTGGMFISPDGERLAIVGNDISLFDITNDDSEFIETIVIDGDPGTLRFAPDGDHAFVTIADRGEIVVVDLTGLETIDRLEAGETNSRNRMGVTSEQYFITPADADETVAIVEMDSLDVEQIDVGFPVDTLQYVGNSGTGFSGGYR